MWLGQQAPSHPKQFHGRSNMLNLTTSGSEIRVTTSAAATLDVHASWADLVSSTVTLGQTNTAIVSATTTAVVAGPGSGARNVKTLFIRNKGVVPTNVTVAHYNGTTAFEIYSTFLNGGGQIQYSEGNGFFTSNTSVRAGPHGASTVGSGAFVLPVVNATALTTVAMAADRFEAVPFIPARDLVINQLALEVTTGVAASTFRLGIYADNGATAPGTLLVGTGTLDSAGTGYKTETIASRTLAAGELYWLVAFTSSNPTFRAGAFAGVYTFGAPASGTALLTAQRGTSAYAGGLPASAPAVTANNAAIPAIRLRLT
jgi:hypothetical protein